MRDLHKRWSHRWLTPKARSFHSRIQGLGVVAMKDIGRGEIVCVYGGVAVPKKEIKKYWKIMGHVGIQVEDNFFIVPTTRHELEKTGIFNHSCEPNCGFSNQIILVAIKNIKKGKELVFDYAFCESFMKSFRCNCKSKNCRRIIKQTDWKNKKIQRKYLKYFSPYLKNKVK